ncbi:MAG: hypothetical protein LBI33_01535, partial [Propionibacteriaceae bacterium]|nr:hypothetical protein [Propionibacteriaceae bacterium]
MIGDTPTEESTGVPEGTATPTSETTPEITPSADETTPSDKGTPSLISPSQQGSTLPDLAGFITYDNQIRDLSTGPLSTEIQPIVPADAGGGCNNVSITITGTVVTSGCGAPQAGDYIEWHYQIFTPNGCGFTDDVHLEGVTNVDPTYIINTTNPARLATCTQNMQNGTYLNCTAQYTLTAADIAAGNVTSSATAVGIHRSGSGSAGPLVVGSGTVPLTELEVVKATTLTEVS